MKQILFTLTLFITAFSFGQNTGSISGSVLDLESENMPLAFAKVLIKETGSQVTTNENGVFKFDNLKEASYTLIYSFIGYETKSNEVKVTSNKPTYINIHLGAKALSLDDLASVYVSADKNNTLSN